MKKHVFLLLLLFVPAVMSVNAHGREIKVHVQEFAVSGHQGKDDLKAVFQNMLASRLSSGAVETVESPAGADVLVKGSYVIFGKVFSLDAVAREQGGKVVGRAFQQGESQDELVGAMGRLAQSLADSIAKVSPQSRPTKGNEPRPQAKGIESADIVRAQTLDRNKSVAWSSQRLDGDMLGIAPGDISKEGVRELYVADDHLLRLYRQDAQLKLLAEVQLPVEASVLGIDTADLDNDGHLEAYLTLFASDSLISQVWTSKEGKLVKVADNLPYFFRALTMDGRQRTIFVQQLGSKTDFYGDVYELVKKGASYETRNPLKLPRFGHLFNFNRFPGKDGTNNIVLLNPDGYIIIYSATGEELWRSSDKYGGSQTFFKREDIPNSRTSGDINRWIFLEQRIHVAADGSIIIPQSKGMFVFGNNRSFNKNSVFAFKWNGSSLDELWHTRESQNYLADYFYDEPEKALVLLEVVKKEGPMTKGATQVVIKSVE